MTPEEIRERRDMLMAQETERRVLNWYWLSFADDDGFNGAALIKAFGPITAHYAVKCVAPNLHGQVRMEEIPDWSANEQVNAWLRLRPSIMRTHEECLAFERDMDALLVSLGLIEEPN